MALTTCIICKEGIEFELVTNIALVEQFVKIEVLLPFPRLNTKIDQELVNLSERIAKIRSHDPVNCPFFTNVKGNLNLATHEWMFEHVTNENQVLKTELQQVIANISQMFPTVDEPKLRKKRTAAVVAVLAGTAGAMIGSTLSCGNANPFAECNSMTEDNVATVNDLITTVNNVSDSVMKVENAEDYKMFLVTQQLIQIQELQNSVLSIQSTNWKNLRTQIEIIENNTHVLTDCQQNLYTQQQLAYNGFLISDVLSTVLLDIRSLQILVRNFQTIVLESLTAARAKIIPFTIIPQRVLIPILKDINRQFEGKKPFRVLSLSIEQIAAYYETQLISKVFTHQLGITFMLAIPVSTPDTMMEVYRARTIPMPQDDSNSAVTWNIESPFIAVSENNREYALISYRQLEECIGSNNIRICYTPFATHTVTTPIVGSCIATLFYQNEITIASACSLTTYPLPYFVQAESLGKNRWLLTAQSDNYEIKEQIVGTTNPDTTIHHPGCRVCVIEIPCNHIFEGPNIRMRAQQPFCEMGTPVIEYSTITASLNDIFNLIQTVDDLPQFTDIAEARKELVRKVQLKIVSLPKQQRLDRATLIKIATPVAIKMRKVKTEKLMEKPLITSVEAWIHLGFLVIVWIGLIFLIYKLGKCVYRLYGYPLTRSRDGMPIALEATEAISVPEITTYVRQPQHIYEAAT